MLVKRDVWLISSALSIAASSIQVADESLWLFEGAATNSRDRIPTIKFDASFSMLDERTECDSIVTRFVWMREGEHHHVHNCPNIMLPTLAPSLCVSHVCWAFEAGPRADPSAVRVD